MEVGVPLGNILEPILNGIYTSDHLLHLRALTSTFDDVFIILSSQPEPISAFRHLQQHLSFIEKRLQKIEYKDNILNI